MLDNTATFNKYGYYVENLSIASHKPIEVVCDYCKQPFTKEYKAYNSQRKVIQKDSCSNSSCKYKKREDISVQLHGVKNSAQRQDVRDKISQINTDRLRSEQFKTQAKATNIKKYGSNNPMLVPEIIEKQKQTMINKYGTDNIMKYADTAKKAAIKMKQTKINKGLITIYDGKTRPELAKEIGFSRSYFGKLVAEYGIDEALTHEKGETSLQKIFRDMLDTANINYISQYRIKNKIADFKIQNLLVEIDGLFWHSDGAKIDNDYHVNKRKIYLENGYDCLFFREDELKSKLDIIKSILLYKLGKSKKIFARKCSIETIDNKASDMFFETNHLMGKGKGKTYVLKHENNIVSAIRIKRLKNKDYEISRFCNSLGYTVIGGFSKLLKFVLQDLSPSSIITFIDLRYGKGEYLSHLGFKYIHSYPSFRWTDGSVCWHRLKFPGNSGYNEGLFKIWDCGQAKWKLTI